jgi:hypothetical protein
MPAQDDGTVGRRDAGLIAAWIDALLPAPMLLCLQPLPDSLTCFFAAAMLASVLLRASTFVSNSISNDRFQ